VGEKILLEFYGCLNGSAVGGKEKEHRKEMDSKTQSKSGIPLCSKKFTEGNTEPRNSKRNKFFMDPFITRTNVCSAGNKTRY